MKYFTSDLWLKIQNSTTRKDAEMRWDKNDKIYEKEFKNIRKQLPTMFLNIFDKECGFHDFVVEEINIKKIEKKTVVSSIDICIKIKNGNKCYDIILKSVETYRINIVDRSYCICGNLSWGYSEFEILKDGNIKLSLLCDVVNEFEFTFRKIQIKKCKHKKE